jgi:hypothetical protein
MDDRAPHHPKFFRAGLDAFGLDVAGIAYCNREGTDGYVPASDLGLVFPGVPRARLVAIAKRLVAVGRWRAKGGGWEIHDFHDYQPTAAEAAALRASTQAAKVAGGQARAASARRDAGRFSPAAHQQADQQASEASTVSLPTHPNDSGPFPPAGHQQATSSPAGTLLAPAHQQTTSPVPVPVPEGNNVNVNAPDGESIIDEILLVTRDAGSTGYYRRLLAELGADRVRGLLSETRQAVAEGRVRKSAARYFTDLAQRYRGKKPFGTVAR